MGLGAAGDGGDHLGHGVPGRVDGLAKAHGPNLTISYTVNPELIGGLRIRVGNDVLDGSVQGRLARLANAF